jgi:AAA domain
VTTTTIANQKGGVGKTTTAINVGVLLARQGLRTLVVDTDAQCALTRQLGLGDRCAGVNLVDVLAGRALTQDVIVTDVHGVDVIPAARALAGVEMSLVGELGRERFLHAALEPVLDAYEQVVIDTPPNLGLLTVNALVCADRVIAPVSAEDEGGGARDPRAEGHDHETRPTGRHRTGLVHGPDPMGAAADLKPDRRERAHGAPVGAGGTDSTARGRGRASSECACPASGERARRTGRTRLPGAD